MCSISCIDDRVDRNVSHDILKTITLDYNTYVQKEDDEEEILC